MTAFEGRHLDGALSLSLAAGWPHRREDWALSLSVSTGLVAPEGDRVVGTALMSPFGDGSATINLIIVDRQLRGRGLGRRLTTAALALAGDRACRLIATAEGLPLYEKLGFGAIQEIYQHQGFVEVSQPLVGIEWAETASLPDLIALDSLAYGGDRPALLEQIASHGQFAVMRRKGAVVAFAAVGPFGRGQVIGPVVAPDEELARQLIRFVAASRDGQFLRIDVPGDSDLSHWLEGLGFAHVGGGIAMTRGDVVSRRSQTARTFALASQAFG
ncbi:MAG: GNAT family N-acetyltransferase [Devosia sp.]